VSVVSGVSVVDTSDEGLARLSIGVAVSVRRESCFSIALLRVLKIQGQVQLLQLPVHDDVEDDGGYDQHGLHDGRSGRHNTLTNVETKQSQKAELDQVHAYHKLLEGARIEAAFGIDVRIVDV